jgi:hypothetical protein
MFEPIVGYHLTKHIFTVDFTPDVSANVLPTLKQNLTQMFAPLRNTYCFQENTPDHKTDYKT